MGTAHYLDFMARFRGDISIRAAETRLAALVADDNATDRQLIDAAAARELAIAEFAGIPYHGWQTASLSCARARVDKEARDSLVRLFNACTTSPADQLLHATQGSRKSPYSEIVLGAPENAED
jgi:hypothetical protein